MPGAWISGQLRARAVSPGKFNPVIYVAKCWVPAAPHRLLFPGTEEVTEASFTTTSRCLRVPRTAGRTAQMQTTDVLVGERREPTCLQQLGDVADHIGCELDVQRLALSGCGTTIASRRAGDLPAHRSVRQAGARRVPCRQAVASLGSPGYERGARRAPREPGG